MSKLAGWTVLVMALVAAFIGGRASVRVSDPKLRDSLAVFKNDNRRLAMVNDSLARDAADSRTAELAANQRAEDWRRKATAHTAAADSSGAIADRAHATLAWAKTCADSVASLLTEAENRQTECTQLRAANADLLQSIGEEQAAKAEKDRQLRDANGRASNDSTQLGRATTLIGKLKHQVRGCRLPLIGVPCPTAIGSYDLTDRSFHAGAGIPVRSWLTLSVTTRLGGKP